MESIKTPPKALRKRPISLFFDFPTYIYMDKPASDLTEGERFVVEALESGEKFLNSDYVLAMTPDYLKLQIEQLNQLLSQEDSLLPISYRYYIAIMAVCCHQCEYLLKPLEQ